jgi:MFS transporter, YQGE family, putative transporter
MTQQTTVQPINTVSNDLEDTVKQLLVSHNLHIWAFQLFGFYSATFIFRITRSIGQIALFQVCFLSLHGISFWFWSKVTKKGYAIQVRLVSILMLFCTFLSFALFRDYFANHLLAMAVIWGIANGTYWCAFHRLSFDLTSHAKRGNFFGVNKMLGTFVTAFTPLIGGWLISQNWFGWSYGWVFALCGLFYLLSAFFSNFKYVPVDHGDFALKDTFKQLWQVSDMRKILVNYCLLGGMVHFPIVQMVISIIFLQRLGTEFKLGSVFTGILLVSALLVWSFGKFVRYKHYKRAYITAVTLYIISIVMVAIFPGFWSFAGLIIVAQTLTPIAFISRSVYDMHLFENMSISSSARSEYILVRELCTMILGWMVGYLILFFVTMLNSGSDEKAMTIFLFLLVIPASLAIWNFSMIKAKV